DCPAERELDGAIGEGAEIAVVPATMHVDLSLERQPAVHRPLDTNTRERHPVPAYLIEWTAAARGHHAGTPRQPGLPVPERRRIGAGDRHRDIGRAAAAKTVLVPSRQLDCGLQADH